jgi:SAM-dependent methyltransferase
MSSRSRVKEAAAGAPYDAEYFTSIRDYSLESARAVAPLLTELVTPSSVLDVGCGGGAWLAAFHELGVTDLLGIDGYAPASADLLVSRHYVAERNLREPFDLGRRFDLALCLEVAEHLPAESAGRLVESITAHTDVVAFSAALPGQGGQGHINEQWMEYWLALFEAYGFRGYDVLRPRLWGRPGIASFYQQNLVLFASAAAAKPIESRIATLPPAPASPLSLVHPEVLLQAIETPRGVRHALQRLLWEIGLKAGLIDPGAWPGWGRHVPFEPAAQNTRIPAGEP